MLSRCGLRRLRSSELLLGSLVSSIAVALLSLPLVVVVM
jgi:hypothetical protein